VEHPGFVDPSSVARDDPLPADRARHATLFPAAVQLVRWRGAWPTAVLVLTVLALTSTRGRGGPLPSGVQVGLEVLATLPLLAARRWPAPALGMVLGANLVFLVAARLSWPVTGVVAWLVGLALCPLLLPRARALTMLALAEAAVLAAVFVPRSLSSTPWDASVAEALAALLAWLLGENLRSRREAAERLVVVGTEVRALRELGVAAQSRASLARDLHDVVAHHVSLIAVRAATAPYQVPDLPPGAAVAFAEIAEEARAALDELRAVLGVLRAPDGEAEHSPSPTLGDLPALAEKMSSTGMDVDVTTSGAPRPLPAAVELCCYRVTQEALTNAGRHAPGAKVNVQVRFAGDRLDLVVANGAPPGGRSAAAGGSGFGLVGMRERVAALGGQFVAGSTGTGFRIAVSLPTPSAST
jgi:signal transduction histidine kinase